MLIKFVRKSALPTVVDARAARIEKSPEGWRIVWAGERKITSEIGVGGASALVSDFEAIEFAADLAAGLEGVSGSSPKRAYRVRIQTSDGADFQTTLVASDHIMLRELIGREYPEHVAYEVLSSMSPV